MAAELTHTPTILLTGATGQVGFELRRSLMVLGRVVALGRHNADFADSAALRGAVQAARPDVIVNAAAYTAVDLAESEPELAHQVNAQAPAVLAEYAAQHAKWLVHYSTDYVFAGEGTQFQREADPAAPRSVYGQSKLAGEQAIAASGARHYIFRTSWVFGAHGHNFAKTLLRLARERDALRVVADQTGVPTPAALIADITAHVLARALAGPAFAPPAGLYHLCPSGETTWHEYACELVRMAAGRGVALRAGPDAIEAITTADFPTAAQRPANSRLDTSKLLALGGLHLPHWQEGLAQVLERIIGTEN